MNLKELEQWIQNNPYRWRRLNKGDICDGCGMRAEKDGESHHFCHPGSK